MKKEAKTEKKKMIVGHEIYTASRKRIAQIEEAIVESRYVSYFLKKKYFAGVSAISLTLVLITSPLLLAFEAHIINVTASIAQIDAPILTSPGGVSLQSLTGGTNLSGTIDVFITNPDEDAEYLYYTYGAGLDPLSVPAPFCGQTGPNGEGGLKVDIELVPLSLTSDTVVKAIGCDGDGSILPVHQSLINTKVYDFNDLACSAFDVIFPPNLAVLAAGPGNSSSGDVFVSSNVTINGDARSNDDINANGDGTNRFINGNATAGDNVEQVNFTVSGTTTEGAASTTLPDINIPYWQDKANDGGTVNGSLVIPGNVGTAINPLDLGPSLIMGNVSIASNNVVTLHGPLHIHGNLTLNSNITFNQDPAFDDQFVTIIVDGTVDISSNVTFNGAGTIGTFLLVSKANPQSGDNAAIETSSSSSDLGDLVLYASNGDVHINSNRTLLAIFAKLGTSSSGPAIDLDSNVTINYRTLPTKISCGPIFTPIDQVVINEFVPALSGSDTGSPGLPLDGEFVELYNGSNSTVDVNGWVLYDDVVPTGSATTKTWTDNSDFTPGISSNTFIETSGDDRIRVTTGQTSGTFEMIFDSGEGNKSDWQNLTWTESLSGGADICLAVATSNDGVSYTPYSTSDCASPFSLTGALDSRYIKWKSTHTRTSGSSSNNADLTELTINYNLFNYNELVITPERTNTGLTTIPAGGLLVVYRNGDPDFDMDNDGTDTVKLYNGHVWISGTLVDSRAYNYGGTVPDDKSFTRMPDGTNNWIDPDPTPGEPNDEFIDENINPTPPIIFESEPSEEEVEEIAELKEEIVTEPLVVVEEKNQNENNMNSGRGGDNTGAPTSENTIPETVDPENKALPNANTPAQTRESTQETQRTTEQAALSGEEKTIQEQETESAPPDPTPEPAPKSETLENNNANNTTPSQ